MERLDRLGWTVGMAIASQGVKVGIRSNRADALERVAQQLPDGWKPARSPVVDMIYSISAHDNVPNSRIQRFNLLFGGAQKLARTLDFDELLDVFNRDLPVSVAATSHSRLFFQSGVVGWKGRAIMIPGGAGTGKTRLVQALVQAGATYYSDEFAVLDRSGHVHPYAVGVPVDSGSLIEARVPISRLGWPIGKRPIPVGMIVLGHYKRRAVFRPVNATGGEAVLALLANCFSPLREPDAMLSLFADVAGNAIVLKGLRGEADAAAKVILNSISEIDGIAEKYQVSVQRETAGRVRGQKRRTREPNERRGAAKQK